MEEDFFPLQPLQLPFAELDLLVVLQLVFPLADLAEAFPVISAPASMLEVFAAFFLPNIVFPP